mgnify:CR=1 FL=1
MKGGCIYKHGAREYWLVCTADAYFDILDAYGERFAEELLSAGRSGCDCAVGCISPERESYADGTWDIRRRKC